MAQLRLQWMPEFEKVISLKKTAMFYQIHRRLGLMVELHLSSQIPLVKPWPNTIPMKALPHTLRSSAMASQSSVPLCGVCASS